MMEYIQYGVTVLVFGLALFVIVYFTIEELRG